MTSRPSPYLFLLSALTCVTLTYADTPIGRHRRETSFNFPTNAQDIDWYDASATVPTFNAPAPDLSLWNDTSDNMGGTFNPNFDPVPSWNGPHHDDGTDSKPDSQSETTPTTPSPLPKQTTTSSPTKNYRYDCPFSKNFCLYTHPCDKELQNCAMNLKCTNHVCVDKKKPRALQQTTTSGSIMDESEIGVVGRLHETSTKAHNDQCPISQNFCLRINPCAHDQRCSMNMACTDFVCLHKEVVVEFGATMEPNATTQRSKECSGSDFLTCVHGYCKEWNTDTGHEMRCVCDEGWVGLKCDKPCTIDCVHGNCVLDSPSGVVLQPEDVTEDHMKCNCKYGWEGTFCQEETPDLVGEARRRTVIIGLSLGAVTLVVILTSALVLLVLWRKRVIVVMKLVYFFKMEEVDDGRQYDAYISMGTSTRGMEFVKDKLCPMLQDFGFKFYVQARDQLAGEIIVESIHKAMEQSRRTILIITPEYLRNEWSKFEYVIAQVETLRLQQRIIPIVLEDISAEKQNMNKTLKHILASVKCLKFPIVKSSETVSLKEKKRKEDKFWQRLKLTMPKRKKCKEDEEENYTEVSEVESVSTRDHRTIDLSCVDVMYSPV